MPTETPYELIAMVVLGLGWLVVAVVRDRSGGAERRDARQRRARKRARTDHRQQRELERTLPRATARQVDD